jgi:hypothetical protein
VTIADLRTRIQRSVCREGSRKSAHSTAILAWKGSVCKTPHTSQQISNAINTPSQILQIPHGRILISVNNNVYTGTTLWEKRQPKNV